MQGFGPGPAMTNIELASFRKTGFTGDGTPAIQRNIKNLKDFKVNKLSNARQQIEEVHTNLRR